MTGQYPARNRVFGHFATYDRNEERGMPQALDPDRFTLTDMLKAAGYTTGHFGKWHLGDVAPSAYGVDTYISNNYSNVRGGEKLDIWSPEARPTCTKAILDEAMQFYDVIQDPSEMQNLATTQPELTARLKKQAMDWYATIPASPIHELARKNDWRWPKAEEK